MNTRSFLPLIITFLCIGISSPLAAQNNKKQQVEAPKNGWETAGQFSTLFNQSAFNAEWQGGGTSNVAASINLSYDINYRKDKFTWETKVIGNFGMTKVKDQRFARKTSDRLEINSIFGSQIDSTYWNYSFLFNFRSQFAAGYRFFEREVLDETGELIETIMDKEEITRTISPAYLQAGPGILFKPSKDIKVNIAPATARFILVASKFTEVNLNDPDALEAFIPYFGVAANETSRFEMGASVGLYSKFKLMDNITAENIFNLYADYIEDPGNMDIDYTLTIAMTVNKYVTANLTAQTIYDDNAITGLQVREVLGLGFKYDL